MSQDHKEAIDLWNKNTPPRTIHERFRFMVHEDHMDRESLFYAIHHLESLDRPEVLGWAVSYVLNAFAKTSSEASLNFLKSALVPTEDRFFSNYNDYVLHLRKRPQGEDLRIPHILQAIFLYENEAYMTQGLFDAVKLEPLIHEANRVLSAHGTAPEPRDPNPFEYPNLLLSV